MNRLVRAVAGVLRWRWYPLVLALVAFALAVASKQFVYPHLSWNRDEPVYLWQADLLRDGQLTSTDGGYPAIFHPWLSGHHAGRFFTQYPLGWPVAILLGRLLGWPALTLGFACALAIAGTYAFALETTRRRAVAGVAATLLLASPIVAVQSGVFLTYLFALGLGTLFATALLRAARTGSRSSAAVAGLLLGVLVVTRTFDAVVWAAAVGGFVALRHLRRPLELLRLLPAAIAGVLPLVVVQLVHNRLTTGSATTFGISAADPLDRFGFGERRLMPRLDPFEYTPARAAVGTAKHLFFLPWFLVGAHLGGLAALYGAWSERRRAGTGALIAVCVAFPVAYFPFWGIHISSLTTRISGPIYYVPVYAPLCILAALGLARLAVERPRIAAILTVVGLVVTVPVAVGRLGLNRELGRKQTVWAATAATVPDGSIVAVSPAPYLLYLAPEGITRPDAPGRITYVTDADASLVAYVVSRHRPAFLLRPTVAAAEIAPSEHTPSYRVEAVPLELVSATSVEIAMTSTAPRAGTMTVSVGDGTRELWHSAPAAVSAGEKRSFTALLGRGSGQIAIPPGPATVDVTLSIAAPGAHGTPSPVVRTRLLLDGGKVVSGLFPGRTYRPEPRSLAKGELNWLDEPPAADLVVVLRAGVPTGG